MECEPTFHVLFKESAIVEALGAIWRVSLACSVDEVDKDFVENTLLSKVYKALDAQDNEALDEAANACVGLVGSFKA